MTKEEYIEKHGKDSDLELSPIESIKAWKNKIEAFSGFECVNLSQLNEDANIYDYNNAKSEDVNWFKGYINDLSIML